MMSLHWFKDGGIGQSAQLEAQAQMVAGKDAQTQKYSSACDLHFLGVSQGVQPSVASTVPTKHPVRVHGKHTRGEENRLDSVNPASQA